MNNSKSQNIIGLPDTWRIVKLGDIAEYINGYAFKPTDWGGIGLPIIRIQNLTKSSEKINYFSKILDDKYKVKKGDLLISWSASLGAFIWDGEDAWLNQHIFKVTNFSENLDKNYFFYRIVKNIDSLKGKSRGSTMKHITKKEFLNITIPLPPLPEQRAIAHVLRTVQEAREKTEAVIEAAKALKKSMMQYLFTYGPVPIDEAEQLPLKETEVGMVPEGWDMKKFVDFISLQRGKDLPIDKFENGSIPVVGATKILGYHNVAISKGPGVTVVRSGSSAGKPQYIEQDFWPHNVVLYIKNFHGNYEKFVYYYLDFLKLERFKSGVAVPTLNKNIFNNIIIPVPAKRQQEIIAQIFDSIENKIAAEESRKAVLDQLFQTLLHDLMTAKIRVDHISVPVAET